MGCDDLGDDIQDNNERDEFDELYGHALPKDTPGAWIREAIERRRAEEAGE